MMESPLGRPSENIGSGELGLILAAERLFAERGIEGVSLRQVNQAANQKNISAAHYHFGSRDGLVDAVLKFRLPLLDQRRAELLRRPAERPGIRFYLEAFTLPLIEELQPRSTGNYFIRFMRQYEKHVGNYDAMRVISPAGQQVYEALARLSSYLPREISQQRIGHLVHIIHAVLAGAEERLGNGRVLQAELPLITSNLLDVITAALNAPLSAESIEYIGESGSPSLLDSCLQVM